jgi:NAD+ synthase
MAGSGSFSSAVLRIDPAAETQRITETIRDQVQHQLKRKGAVVGVSGGIDSSVVAGLCARAFGPERVLAIMMPEADSDPQSLRLGQEVAAAFGISTVTENLTPMLAASGCYARRDEFVKQAVPSFKPGDKFKIVLPSVAENTGYNLFSLVVRTADGREQRLRMTPTVYLGIVATTNMKQRTRKQIEYYHADRLNYAVAGTPNLLEYDQGFFVKNGDGAADFKPIAHLYKTQVYQLAEYLGVPAEIRNRVPTTDTYSLPQTQEEFYFALPYAKMDLCLYGLNHQVPPEQVAPAVGLTAAQVERVYQDIQVKRRTTRYLHEPPMLVTAAH